jgi:hypothetical protein
LCHNYSPQIKKSSFFPLYQRNKEEKQKSQTVFLLPRLYPIT